MEIWDLYDKNRRKLNRTHCRDENLPVGEYHVVVEIWTINHNQEILLTLRHPSKKEYPNFWENTGGSILAGESSRQGAIRELKEETGIEAEETELIFLGSHKNKNEFFDIYMIKKDVDIADLTMQEGETVAAKWVSIETFDRMIESKEIVYTLINRLKPYREKLENYLFSK